MKKLSTAACVALAVTLSGCMAPPPSQQENIQQAEKMNANQIDAAKQAHSMCIEFGAKPGTRMFYDCMKEQTEAAEYNMLSPPANLRATRDRLAVSASAAVLGYLGSAAA